MTATATIAPGPQYMLALQRANKVRLARAELKRKVAVGQLDAAGVILECPWEAESMAIADLLTSQRRWGGTRCRKFLASIPISENKTIGSMTERQRRSLATALGCGEIVRRVDAAMLAAERGSQTAIAVGAPMLAPAGAFASPAAA